jgi:hypothetical protein
MLARLRPYVLLFLGLTVVYHANLRPVDSGDSLPASLIPFSVVLDHAVTLDRFVPWLGGHVWYARNVIQEAHAHYFSRFPIGTPLLVSPLYIPIAFFGLYNWDPGSLAVFARIAQKFSAAAIAAFSAVVLLVLLKRITTAPWAWCLTLVYAIATETWSISGQALWQHGPAELAIIGSFLCLERWSENRSGGFWLWMCGVCTAAAFIFRPTNLVLLPAAFGALLLARAPLAQHLRFLAAPVLGGFLLALYNLYVFRHLSGGYAVGLLSGSAVTGIAGLFLSPGRGLLVYTPVALFALCAFFPRAAAARREHKPLLISAVIFIILDSLITSRSVMWWGGFCWGPRMLTELVPSLIVLMALGLPVIERPWPRRAFAVLALYSALIQTVGAFFYPKGHWDAGPPSVDAAPARVWDWRDNPIARTVSGGLYWEPYAIARAAITGGLPAALRRLRELNVNPYEEAKPTDLKSRADRGLP